MSGVEQSDGAAVPLYYFEPEGPGWSDYQDDDGIELKSDADALAYAYMGSGRTPEPLPAFP